MPMWSSVGLFIGQLYPSGRPSGRPGNYNSYAVNVGAPNVFVQLRLQSGRNVVGEHPLGERLQFQFSPYGREEQRPAIEPLLVDDRSRPFVVGAVGNDELDLAFRIKMIQVGPAVLFDFSGARAFHVENDRSPRVDWSNVDRARGLDQQFEAFVCQATDQLERLA